MSLPRRESTLLPGARSSPAPAASICSNVLVRSARTRSNASSLSAIIEACWRCATLASSPTIARANRSNSVVISGGRCAIAARPCRRAFRLPGIVRGPELLREFLRLAAALLVELVTEIYSGASGVASARASINSADPLRSSGAMRSRRESSSRRIRSRRSSAAISSLSTVSYVSK
jgi:hypothetical protein